MASAAGKPDRPIDFNREIRPILSNHCFQCHGPDAQKRKGVARPLRLDTEEGAFADLGGYRAIVKGDPEESDLIQRVGSDDPLDVMPPPKAGERLAAKDVALLTDWVRQGASYARHWSYVKPARPTPPGVRDGSWPRNAVDAFILSRLEREGLRPSPEAGKHALIRRVALDLTGLPPTPEEVERFARDDAPGAYDRLVDRLLASPAFGEHWARMWLDMARYADSAGYADDPPRTIWSYRDYVVRSLNANKPFDQFTVEQIAGDLLPAPTDEQLVATAFHRNTLTNNEGGTNDEEFRNVAVTDRVNTTMAVWMGSTLACAQCHDHKYDPFTQKEYFQLFALFNNTGDADRRDESPLLPLYDGDRKAPKDILEGQIARLKTTGERPELLPALNKQLAGLPPSTTVPILRELPSGARRKTQVQHRGNYLDLGPEVSEGVPAAFPPLPAGAPANRLTLARWLVDGDNPLTPRVLANRCWEQVFGAGLVPTPEEFGT
ncbi:MAG: PSD1 and planctomycete cytochrome C domain-containing protein, partial [Planctomycetia bacterium]|nr:PSD1 and planctomycete cytochrome C domain-containing protein [Planctomycetia bacterium]